MQFDRAHDSRWCHPHGFRWMMLKTATPHFVLLFVIMTDTNLKEAFSLDSNKNTDKKKTTNLFDFPIHFSSF